MSWSISIIGKPDNVVKALEDQVNKLTGQSLEEYKAALPSITGIVKLNYNSNGAFQLPVKVDASGHGSSGHGSDSYGTCTVKIEYLNGTLV